MALTTVSHNLQCGLCVLEIVWVKQRRSTMVWYSFQEQAKMVFMYSQAGGNGAAQMYRATYPDRQHHPHHTTLGAIYWRLCEHGSHGGHFEHLLWHGSDSGHVLCARALCLMLFCSAIYSRNYVFPRHKVIWTFMLHFQSGGGLVAQAVRRSPPTAGVPSLHLGHSMWVSWWTKRDFSRGFSRFPLPQISFHHFSKLISSISFHFISPCDGASGVVGRHPCYSRTYNIWASSHLIPRPDLVLDTNWGYFYSSQESPLKFIDGLKTHPIYTQDFFFLEKYIQELYIFHAQM